MNDQSKNSITNCQISHILVGLSVIVFYKLAKFFKLKDKHNNIDNYNTNYLNNSIESFDTSISKDINKFISGIKKNIPTVDQVSTLTADQINAYTSQLNTLTSQISQFQAALASPSPAVSTSDLTNFPSVDIAAQQQYQQFQIDYLNKQITKSQDILNSQSVSNSSTNYKPIKVFSSCVIANADGSTTIDQPVSNTSNMKTGSSSSASLVSPFTDMLINKTSSQSNSQNSDPFLNLSSNTGIFGKLVSEYIK